MKRTELSQLKAFIYKSNRGYTSEASTSDLKNLLEDHLNIKDIYIGNLDCNFSQLKDKSILVLPGGFYVGVLDELENINFRALQSEIKDLNVLAVCSGSYLAANQNHLFSLNYKAGEYGFYPPTYSDTQKGLSFLCDYTGVGPFYPNNNYSFEAYYDESINTKLCSTPYVPFSVKIRFMDNGNFLHQLYAQGPALVKSDSNSSQETRAFFCNEKGDDFEFENNQYRTRTVPLGYNKITEKNMGAVVTRKAVLGKQGGVVAYSTHPEASYKDSKMLRFFQTENKVKLPQTYCDEIKKDAEKTVQRFICDVRETFGL